jgi:hypothetical protein
VDHSTQFKKHGLIRKYIVSKSDGTPVDAGAEYFCLRLDDGGKDPKHVAACRAAVVAYAKAIADHLPELSKELLTKYEKLSAPVQQNSNDELPPGGESVRM